MVHKSCLLDCCLCLCDPLVMIFIHFCARDVKVAALRAPLAVIDLILLSVALSCCSTLSLLI